MAAGVKVVVGGGGAAVVGGTIVVGGGAFVVGGAELYAEYDGVETAPYAPYVGCGAVYVDVCDACCDDAEDVDGACVEATTGVAADALVVALVDTLLRMIRLRRTFTSSPGFPGTMPK